MNKVILIGRLSKDTELKSAGSTQVCKFALAVTRPFKKEETDFINCIAFGKTGETISQYFSKGSKIAITGNIRTGSYDAKDGTKRYTTDVIVESFEFVESNKKDSNNRGGESNEGWQAEPIDDGDMPF